MKRKKFKVAVTSSVNFPVKIEIVRKILDGFADIIEEEMPFRKLSNKEVEEFGNRLSNYDAILVRSGIFTEKLLGYLKATRIIAVHGVGYDQIDVKAAQDLGIWVTNAPGANANSVAELTIGLMIDLFRKISFSNIQIKTNGDWEKARKIGNELFHHRLGIIGYGNIGKRVAKLAQSFGMFIYVYDPYMLKGINKNKRITYCDKVEQLLGISEIVTLHIPLDLTTYHFINGERLKKMKPGSFLINVSRGGIVDEKALYQELISGHLGGAALDLLEQEPPNLSNSLINLKSVILTPHIGASTQEALESTAKIASRQIKLYFQKKLVTFAVNNPG